MEFIMELFSVLIGVAVLGVSVLGVWGICELINYIDNKKHKKWCDWVFENYPELKILLSEYHRLETECDNLLEEIEKARKKINVCVEKNNYLPKRRRIDKHIEELKEQYQELIDTHAKQYRLSEDAKKKLEKFWKTNFPDLREDKWLMWWSE